MTNLAANPPPLGEYVRTKSPDAFRLVVERYAGLVYCACQRHLKDNHLAEDATQAVFLLLSQKAAGVRQARLASWLLTAARYACANIRKSQNRREKREQGVAMRLDATTEKPKSDLTDLLDEALHQLSARDREALISRYLDDSPIERIAQRHNISGAAARKRIERAIAALRRYFSNRGVEAFGQSVDAVLTEQVRGSAMPPEARQAIVVGILEVCRAGPQAAAPAVAIAKGAHAMMIATKIKVAAVAVATILMLGTSGWVVSQIWADGAPAVGKPVSNAAPVSAAPADNGVALYIPTPATQPAVVDLSSPSATFESFFAAVRTGDRDAVYKCITADPNRAPTLMDGLVAWNITQNHLTQAAVQFLGGDGAAVTRITTFDLVWQKIGRFAPPPEITGDDATITYDVSKLPQQIQPLVMALISPDLSSWAHSIFYFHRQNNQWKLDLDRSMHVDLDVRRGNVAITDEKALVGVFSANAQICDLVATDVRNGNIASMPEATNALDRAINQVHHKCHYNSLSLKVLPTTQPDADAPQ